MHKIAPAKIFQTSTFRLACLFSAGILVLISAVSCFIYWQVAVGIVQRADDLLLRDGHILTDDTVDAADKFIERRLKAPSRVIVWAGLFDSQGKMLAGHLQTIPSWIIPDGRVYPFPPSDPCCQDVSRDNGRVISAHLASGETFVLMRNVQGIDTLRQTVAQAMMAGVLPAILLALGIGTLMGRRTARWAEQVQMLTTRIEHGDIWKRLPVPEGNQSTRWLVESINRILDGIGEVVDTTRNTNAHLAHDLLAPISGVRAKLERATANTGDIDEMRNAVVQAISGLDQTVRLASGLLKISTIERGHIRNHFQPVALDNVLHEVGELFSVIAEDRNITLQINASQSAMLMGDRDLLTEAVANLVDNAIKYTPEGGSVRLYLERRNGCPIIGVSDNGPGLPPEQRDRVLDRYYRFGDTSQIPGHGLGLSLVSAVARLHNLTLSLTNADPGLIVEISSEPVAPE